MEIFKKNLLGLLMFSCIVPEMCCKCPPFTTIVAYLIVSILLSFYFHYTDTFEENLETILIKPCPDFLNETLSIHLDINKINEHIQIINGNISIEFDSDTSTEITLLGSNKYTTEVLLKRHTLCQLIGEILMEPHIVICPLPSGFYRISNVEMLTFDEILARPLENYKKLRMEIVKNDSMVVACREFQIIKSNGIDDV